MAVFKFRNLGFAAVSPLWSCSCHTVKSYHFFVEFVVRVFCFLPEESRNGKWEERVTSPGVFVLLKLVVMGSVNLCVAALTCRCMIILIGIFAHYCCPSAIIGEIGKMYSGKLASYIHGLNE